ncbi:MAG: hypothetical protein LQ339_008492 [Xanthoria mediterranea]|nr:MAG: hypothetical protein LQ339_008492 [Xanthoria mediterranea]
MAPSATSPQTMTAKSEATAPLPLISLEPLLDPTTPQAHQASHALLSAFRTSGFLYLTNYSSLIPRSDIDKVFRASAHFFARPQPQKDLVALLTPTANRGYQRPGREKVSRAATAADVARERQQTGDDMKETYEIGREAQPGNPQPWPDTLDGDGVAFRVTMQAFFLKCQELHLVLMRGIAVGMGLDAHFFDPMLHVGDNNLRLLHYPSVAAGGFEGGKRMRAGAHSDYGTLTFLFQDERGGLQVEKKGDGGGGGWMDVEPQPDTIVVNAGDLMARWSNDLIRSTKHRVVEPPHTTTSPNTINKAHPPRYSVAYFCNPNYEAWIEALPGTFEEEGGKRYEGIYSKDYLYGRLNATVGA